MLLGTYSFIERALVDANIRQSTKQIFVSQRSFQLLLMLCRYFCVEQFFFSPLFPLFFAHADANVHTKHTPADRIFFGRGIVVVGLVLVVISAIITRFFFSTALIFHISFSKIGPTSPTAFRFLAASNKRAEHERTSNEPRANSIKYVRCSLQ